MGAAAADSELRAVQGLVLCVLKAHIPYMRLYLRQTPFLEPIMPTL